MKFSLKIVALLLGPILFIIIGFVMPQFGFSTATCRVLGIAAWMVCWWIFEATPIPVTAMLPIVLFPTTGVLSVAEASAPYASPIIFLFMGGFMLALGMQKHNLHQRIALNLIKLTGTNANGIILGFMLATAMLSMWISNTATTVMMLPIALSVVSLLGKAELETEGFKKFKLGLLLSIAYAANIGGMGTIIGTPPNVVLLGYVNSILNDDITFLEWMKIGVPIVIIMLYFSYYLITKVLFVHGITEIKGAEKLFNAQLRTLGNWSREEKAVAVIFGCTAFLWIFKQQLNAWVGFVFFNDTVTAMMGGMAMFILPITVKGKSLLNWGAMKELPWGILILFGGGMSLATAMENVGIIEWIGTYVSSFERLPTWLLVLILTTLVLFMTELMSNVALTTIMIPMAMGIAAGYQISPLLLAIPVALASSCAFMMPISTPPNAVVFSSGFIRIKEMVKAGFIINLAAVVVIVLFSMIFLS